jgi:hypothetical protein
LKDIITSINDGHPRFRDMEWKQTFEKQQVTNPLQAMKDIVTQNFPSFSLPLGKEFVKFTVWLSADALWSRYNTLSQIANLDVEKKVREEVFEALKEEDVERNARGDVAVHGVTYLVWTSRA